MRPFGVLAENGDAEKIRAYEQGQEGARGISCGQDVGKDGDAEDAKAGESGLGHAGEKRGAGEQGPLPMVEVHGRG